MHHSPPGADAALPMQPFFGSPGQRVGLARERFFGNGQRPTGLVSEAVIQSWTRCDGARRNPREALAFDPVSRSGLRAALGRSQGLLEAAGDEITRLETALGGTACRVLLVDARGVVVHATPPAGAEPVLRQVSRVGVNLSEGAVGTNAPAVVLKTGAPVTVLGAEHYFDCVQTLHCAAAPVRDGRGQLAGVLDLTVEAKAFGFDAAALVGVYATAIENRLLQAGAGEHLVLQFQVCATMLGSPLQALCGVDGSGRLAWMNGTAQQLLGRGCAVDDDAQALLDTTLAELLARSTDDAARPLRLRNGLTVWLRARLRAQDGVRPVVALAPARPVSAAAPPTNAAPAAAPAVPPAAAPVTLVEQTREVIERTLAEHGGNISRAARALGVSRGLLYRRLREWAGPGPDAQ